MKVNEKLSILLILERSKTSKDGKAPITVRLTVDSKRAELSLGQKIKPDLWNQEAGMASGNTIEARQINTCIDRVKAELRRQYDILSSQHNYVSAAMVKLAYQGKKPQESKPFLATLDFIIDKLEKKVDKGMRAKGTLSRWKTTKSKVENFLAFEYKQKDIPLDQIVYAFAEDFADYLMLEEGLENNTAMKYLKNVKQTLKAAVERNWLLKNPIAGYKCGYFNPERDILNEEEIMQLYMKHLPIQRLAEVRDAYIFMCFTGYAYSGYGFYDKHINDNLISAIKNDPNKRLLVNFYEQPFNEEKVTVGIVEKLGIARENVTIVNNFAKEFFNSKMNIEFFSSIFPEQDSEIDVLPQTQDEETAIL